MKVPTQIINRLIHYKKQILILATTKILSVVAICQMLKISRNTAAVALAELKGANSIRIRQIGRAKLHYWKGGGK